MRRYFGVIIITLVMLTAGACVDEISFETDRDGGQIVVDGGIYDRPGPYTLHLGLTTEANVVPIPLDNAIVRLFDENGNYEYYRKTGSGKYSLPGETVTGRRGGTYRLEIQLPDGSVYGSIPETIPHINGFPGALLRIGTVPEQSASGRIRDVPAIFVNTNTIVPQTDEPLYLKWSVESVYAFIENEPSHPLAPPPDVCYVYQTRNPQTISIISSKDLESNLIEGKELSVTRIDQPYQYYIRHVFLVHLHSITERRYQYWNHVDQMINQTGTIFDVPPATVRGNIINLNDDSDTALGYFEAAALNSSPAFVTRGNLPISISNPCPAMGAVCNNCLLLENSTLERPIYF